MQVAKNEDRRWLLSLSIMNILLVGLVAFSEFNAGVAIGTLCLEASILIWLGKKLMTESKEAATQYPQLYFHLVSLGILGLATYILVQASYTEQISLWQWLYAKRSNKYNNIDFEIGLSLIIYYIAWFIVYFPVIRRLAKENIHGWLPAMWAIIAGGTFSHYLRYDKEHLVQASGLIIGFCLLGIWTIYTNVLSRASKIKYQMPIRSYSILVGVSFLITAIIGLNLPNINELPGTRALHHIRREIFENYATVESTINKVVQLTNEVPHSEAELFKVQTNEKLYLRDIAYQDYVENTWQLPEDIENVSQPYSIYELALEYTQLEELMDEIIKVNSEDTGLLSEYKWLNSFEKSVKTQKRYMVLQNPINKINYFTVNGLISIKDEVAKEIYYYQDMNTYYFYNDTRMEPSHYVVNYYDHIPRVGSREYVFLHKVSGEVWKELYTQMMAYQKSQSSLTYAPIAQYEEAKSKYLQIPQTLQSPLKQLATRLTKGEVSDVGKAEIICEYLKENYTYGEQTEKAEGDKVQYFLFESKEGICQDFASSMVLLCRSIGLPAKYITGYLVQEKEEQTENYIVREKDAHAYAEVYIAGYGWMNFDPTPQEKEPIIQSIQEEPAEMGLINNMVICIVIGLVLMSFVSVRRCIKGIYREIAYLIIPKEKQLEHLINDTLKVLAMYDLPIEKGETLSQYAARLRAMGVDITLIINLYEKQKYGHIPSNQEQLKKAKLCYKQLKRQVKITRLK